MSEKQKRQKPFGSKPWSDDELRIAVDGYLYMLRLELSGVLFSAEEMARFLTEGPLPKRNAASIRYRMRNISYVFSRRKLPTLKAYSLAPRVGSGVRQRIEKILDERSENLSQLIAKSRKKEDDDTEKLNEVLVRLDRLEKYILEIEGNTLPGIGHNNPPEPIEKLSPKVKDAKESVQNLKKELNSPLPDKEKIKKEQNILIKIGLGMVTLFIGGGLAKAGETLLASHIIEALEVLASYIQTLG